MISHLGKMLSLVVGGTWAARQHGEDVFGLAVIGDGGTSTGEFHESLNVASVTRYPRDLPGRKQLLCLFHADELQYRCRQFPTAPGYGIEGKTIDGADAWTVYSAGSRRPGSDARRARAEVLGVHDPAAPWPRRLRQGRIRPGRIDCQAAARAIRCPRAQQASEWWAVRSRRSRAWKAVRTKRFMRPARPWPARPEPGAALDAVRHCAAPGSSRFQRRR